MAKLENTENLLSYFGNIGSKAVQTGTLRGSELALSVVAKTAGIVSRRKLDGGSPFSDRVIDGLVTAGNSVLKVLSTEADEDDTWTLTRTFPGFIGEYKEGKLFDIVPFQFEPVVNSDSRSVEFSEVDYGVNSLHSFKKVTLRKIQLETYFATLDSLVFTSHYVEQKIRKLQSFLYPHETFSSPISNANTLLAPSLISLFIGDKFMRRRLPKLKINSNPNGSLYSVQKNLPTDRLNELFGFAVTAEPIVWRVVDVSVDWSDAPSNLNFSELNYNLIPGQSKLPMFQKVTMSLEEHRAPNTYETENDAASFTGFAHPNGLATPFI